MDDRKIKLENNFLFEKEDENLFQVVKDVAEIEFFLRGRISPIESEIPIFLKTQINEIEIKIGKQNLYELEEYVMDITLNSHLSLAHMILIFVYKSTCLYLQQISNGKYTLPSELRELLSGYFKNAVEKIGEENKYINKTGLLQNMEINEKRYIKLFSYNLIREEIYYQEVYSFFIKQLQESASLWRELFEDVEIKFPSLGENISSSQTQKLIDIVFYDNERKAMEYYIKNNLVKVKDIISITLKELVSKSKNNKFQEVETIIVLTEKEDIEELFYSILIKED